MNIFFRIVTISLFCAAHLHAQPFILAFNPTIGSVHKVEITKENFSINQVIDEYEIDIAHSVRTYHLLSFTTLEHLENGYRIALTIDSSYVSMHSGVGSSGEYLPGLDVQKSYDFLLGTSILLHVSNQGELLNINGLEDIVNAFSINLAGVDAVAACSNLIQEFVHFAIPLYENEQIATGQTWQCVKNMDKGTYKYIEEIQYKLIRIDNEFADLSVYSSLVPEESGDVTELRGMKMKIKPSGTANGAMTVDLTSGWVVVSEWLKNSVISATIENLSMQIPPLRSKEKIVVRGI